MVGRIRVNEETNLALVGPGGISGILTVPHGGSGAASLTGALIGNGTAAFTAISYQAVTAWTPTDISGASLTITNNGSSWCRFGPIIIVQINITYPVTGNGAAATISTPVTGLIANGVAFQAVQGATGVFMTPVPGVPGFQFYTNLAAGSLATNTTLSALTLRATVAFF